MTCTRPVLRYHGGKWRLAPWIISHFPEHRVYVEPYGGAASVLMRKARSYAEVYNDLDEEIVNVFRVLRDTEMSKKLAEQVRLTPFARAEFDLAYEPSFEMVERARKTMVKAWMGFGSAAVTQVTGTKPGAGFKATTGFRSNSNRSGTTPAHDWRNYPNCIEAFTERLKGVILESRPALKIIECHDGPEALLYIDPPYVHATRALTERRTPQSYRFEMSDADHLELLNFLRGSKSMVALSGYPGTLYAEALPGWTLGYEGCPRRRRSRSCRRTLA